MWETIFLVVGVIVFIAFVFLILNSLGNAQKAQAEKTKRDGYRLLKQDCPKYEDLRLTMDALNRYNKDAEAKQIVRQLMELKEKAT